MIKVGQHPTIEDLQTIQVFAGLPEEHLNWLASQMDLFEAEAGEVFFHAGDPAEHLAVFFTGEMRAERTDGRVYISPAGQVTGLLPYSRMTNFSSTVKAGAASRGAMLHKDHFPEMLSRMPALNDRLVRALSSRIREDATDQQQQEKLMALGKISAGLAHEINNPAAAARRAADTLRGTFEAMRKASLRLDEGGLAGEARIYLTNMEAEWAQRAKSQIALDTLEHSEWEEVIEDWLTSQKIERPWELASALVDAGCTREDLDGIAHTIPASVVGSALARLSAASTATRLIEEIESSISRVSELVRAVKEYSYMDQAPQQDVDIHEGIESTLVMLGYRLKGGVEVTREYDRQLPKVHVHGSELNQVWTNLISNAVEAMQGKGKLWIRTGRDLTHLVVEVIDNGPGVPPEIRTRIFEPFFTTKAIGEGTGLGLDIVRRIIRKHSGDISVESRVGETKFVVRIPLKVVGESKA